ncbi:hypothetical protein HUJ04_000002 [Dendroctonus ponderosae]|nr:hypothetical protein HUJ04_000002 [Dendroctonus ponderosae]
MARMASSASAISGSGCSVVKCEHCSVTDHEFHSVLNNNESLLDFFYRHNVLTCHARCPCGAQMIPTVQNRGRLYFRCQKMNPTTRRKCNTYHSSQLGGPGQIVEIDVAKVGKRKYNRGRIIDGQWIFGGLQRSSGQFFVVPVESRTSAAIFRIIQEHIRPGTTIVSDCWSAFDCIDTGAHTQNIERKWVEVRKLIPRFGRKKDSYLGYLAEALFKMRYPDHTQRLHIFWATVAQMYPGITHF